MHAAFVVVVESLGADVFGGVYAAVVGTLGGLLRISLDVSSQIATT
jgi:hypothetical protein